MSRILASVAVLAVFATPALAFETEEIGTLEADFGGEAIVQPTVRATAKDEVSTTAFLTVLGAGFSSLSLAGYTPSNARLGIDATFQSVAPDADSRPFEVNITYSPDGTGNHWTSEEAPSAASIAFTELSSEGDEGRVTGTFSGVLCYAEGYGAEPDMDNCRPIEGRFDTPIMIER